MRGRPAPQPSRFSLDPSVPGQPVVVDAATGLVWQGCAAGLSGSDCRSGSTLVLVWSEALDYCEDLAWGGHSDWRLPSYVELYSIVEAGHPDPTIDETHSPATPSYGISGGFWTSTTVASALTNAWLWNTSMGFIWSHSSYADKATNAQYVRCVR